MKPNRSMYARLGVLGLPRLNQPVERMLFLCSGLIGLLLFAGCETPVPGRYVMSVPPTESTRAFRQVTVAQVEVGPVQDPLTPATTVELRNKLIEQIQKKKIYEAVANDVVTESALVIQPKVVDFHKGSQAARYFLGGLAGESAKAHLDVECKFVNKATGVTTAQGIFTGEIMGGLFGGSADEKLLSKYVAQHVANFLSKGK